MTRIPPDLTRETAAALRGLAPVAGIDEVGRGPLCGPVTAAAVVLNPDHLPPGMTDSKALGAAQRDRIFAQLQDVALIGVGHASVAEIDALNILNASHLAMARAVAALPCVPGFALVDGNRLPPGLPCPAQSVVKGDALCLSIAAASIVAKVVRDRIMVDLAQQYPGYGWERNAGYPTKDHLAALQNLGVTPEHRRSFRPVHKILYQEVSVSR